MKKKYQFLGFLIEQSLSGWWVVDWDYEANGPSYGPFASERLAQNYVIRRETGG